MLWCRLFPTALKNTLELKHAGIAAAKFRQSAERCVALDALDKWPRTDHFVKEVNALGGQARSVILPELGHYVSEEAVRHANCIGNLRTMDIHLDFSTADPQKGYLA